MEHKERCLTQMAQTDASIATLDESIAKADRRGLGGGEVEGVGGEAWSSGKKWLVG